MFLKFSDKKKFCTVQTYNFNPDFKIASTNETMPFRQNT